jgi:flagellin
MEAANTDINGSTSGETNVMQEFSQLQAELDQIDNGTTYNGVNLFSPDTNGETATPGTATAAGPTYSFQVGITGGTADVVSISGANFDISSTGLGVGTLQSATFASGYSINGGTGGAGTIDNYTDADAVISNIATAIQSISLYQGQLGAVSNRLGSDLQTTSVASQSLEAANSAIADTNVATTSAMFASQQTLEQAGVAVLAQANQLSALALKLLQ